MSAVAYEPFVLRWEGPELRIVESPVVRSMIERAPTTPWPWRLFTDYKQLLRDGWDVTALLAPNSKTVLLIACHTGNPPPFGADDQTPAGQE